MILASMVLAADTRIQRAKYSQDGWTREIDLYVPVSDETLWMQNSNLIKVILNFLTGDKWRVFFFKNTDAAQELIESTFEKRRNTNIEFDCVSLFSGGLDSYIGAIDLVQEGKTPLLVSFIGLKTPTTPQNNCFNAIKKEYKLEDNFINIKGNLNIPTDLNEIKGIEPTTRSRSLMFIAMAVLAASAKNVTEIIIPENGFISLNVPLDQLRMGALSTKTTHPFFISKCNELIYNIKLNTKLKNPYQIKTKGEMLSECSNQELIKKTLKETRSCATSNNIKVKTGLKAPNAHCGYCVPCIIRRASIIKAYGNDPTPYYISNYESQILNTNRAEGKQVRSFQYAIKKISRNPNYPKFAIHIPGPLNADEEISLEQYENVYRNGMLEVQNILGNARTKYID